MERPPNGPNYGMDDYGGFEYDPQIDFAQFLEEARQAQHDGTKNIRSSIRQPEEVEKRRMGQEKKVKKSWKNSLLNWWKPEKKGRTSNETATGNSFANQRKGYVSGPIDEKGTKACTRRRSPLSGPLINLLNLTKCTEKDTNHICLNRANSCRGVKGYGPVYLVT